MITANRYRLDSAPFAVTPSHALSVQPVAAPDGRSAVRLGYPAAQENVDLTYRPEHATGGRVVFRLGRRRLTVRRVRGQTFSAPAGAVVVSARDRYGNVAGG